MIRFYFHPSPNPLKVALFLEESGLAYEIAPVDVSFRLRGQRGRQSRSRPCGPKRWRQIAKRAGSG